MNKNFGVPNWVRNYGFYSFLKVALLFFLDIAQDCSLGQCQTSRVKTSKKILVTQIGAEMIFLILMLSRVCSNLLVSCLLVSDDLNFKIGIPTEYSRFWKSYSFLTTRLHTTRDKSDPTLNYSNIYIEWKKCLIQI